MSTFTKIALQLFGRRPDDTPAAARLNALDQLQVADDYGPGEVLNDQTGANAVLTFVFAPPVASFWVAVVGSAGVVKVDHYGGTPSETRGIPVSAGGALPIPEPASTVNVYAPTGLIVTVWGQRRA